MWTPQVGQMHIFVFYEFSLELVLHITLSIEIQQLFPFTIVAWSEQHAHVEWCCVPTSKQNYQKWRSEVIDVKRASFESALIGCVYVIVNIRPPFCAGIIGEEDVRLVSMLIRNQVASMVRDRQHFQARPPIHSTVPSVTANNVAGIAATAGTPHEAEGHAATLTTLPSQQQQQGGPTAAQTDLASQSAAPTMTNVQQLLPHQVCVIINNSFDKNRLIVYFVVFM